MSYDQPLIDMSNPCYTPTRDGSAFLESLALEYAGPPRSRDQYLFSFCARLLYPPTKSEDEDFLGWPFKSADASFMEELLAQSQDSRADSFGSRAPSSEISSFGTLSTAADGLAQNRNPWILGLDNMNMRLRSAPAQRKRKRGWSFGSDSSAFADLRGPAKYTRSSISLNQSSFEVTRVDDVPDFYRRSGQTSSELEMPSLELDVDARDVFETWSSPVQDDAERLFSLATIVSRLNVLLPGIRIKEKLLSLDTLSYQSIADVLGSDGRFNTSTLALLHHSDVAAIDLSSSLAPEDGLNLGGRQVLQVFRSPGAFPSLSYLALDSAPLDNRDILCLQNLPVLTTLELSSTGIGNEAVFLLVALKPTLSQLYLNQNPAIDDDAVPALVILDRLSVAALAGTSVAMDGLRRLAAAAQAREQDLCLTVPDECTRYLIDMPAKYVVEPEAPLITDPAACAHLTLTALRRNLAAHAAVNAAIATAGTRAELRRALQTVLETRRRDLMVKSLVCRDVFDDGEGEEGGCDGSGSGA